MARTCGACSGTGSVIGDPCATCRGESRVSKELKLNVKVPPGVENGTRIRYAGEGDAGRSGGPRGDLYVVLSIRPHDFFEREGQDLHCVIPISFPQAALGRRDRDTGHWWQCHHQGSRGYAKRQAVACSRQGRVPFLNENGRGDLIVQVVLQTPRKLTRAQRELVTKLAESLAVDKQAVLSQPDGEDEGPVQLGRCRGDGEPWQFRGSFAAGKR